MPTLLTATEVTVLTSISASVATIIAKQYIETVEARIPMMLNNYFTSTDIYINSDVTFNATARSITLDSEHWIDYGFRAGQNIYIYQSYENDQYATISSISDEVLVLTSSYSVVDELSGASILIALVKWPVDVKAVAADMVYFDSDIRGKVASNIKSRSLGPLSESYTTGDEDEYGYPRKITSRLDKYSVVRLM